VVILLHGGCWRARFGLENCGLMAKALADAGYAVWNLEFRRLDKGGTLISSFFSLIMYLFLFSFFFFVIVFYFILFYLFYFIHLFLVFVMLSFTR
jgi:hypothetical protein